MQNTDLSELIKDMFKSTACPTLLLHFIGNQSIYNYIGEVLCYAHFYFQKSVFAIANGFTGSES